MQRRGDHPGEDWQVDFTHMVPCKGYKSRLVLIHTFSGWVVVFPTRAERAMEVAQVLLKEIIPRFGFPQNIQNDNAPFQKVQKSHLDLKQDVG